MSPRPHRLLDTARQVALTVGAVVGAVCVLLAVLAVALDARPLVFRSGSMSPTIDTGALAIAQRVDARDLEVGQVVSVPTGSGERVTHRILTVQHDGDSATLQLKGDANDVPDAAPYVVGHADRVVFAVPWVGYLVGWLTGPLGLVVLGLYAGLLVVLLLRPARRGAGPPRHRRAVPVLGLVVLVGAGVPSGLALEARTTPTLAAWADTSAVSGTGLTAYSVSVPGAGSCAPIAAGTNASRGVVLSWSEPTTPALSYDTTVTGLSAPSRSVTSGGGTAQLQVTYNPATAANLSQIVTVQATGYPSAATSWRGATASWKFKTGNGQTVQPVCGETTPPAATVYGPDSTSRTRSAEQTFLASTAACQMTGIILCGTMSDASATTVGYRLARTVGAATTCWNGSAWTAAACASNQAATTTVYAGQSVWYDDGTTSTVYDTAGSYTLTVELTDSWANSTTRTVSFTLT